MVSQASVCESSALNYYARHGAALFPIPAGQKSPTGIVASFAKDWSQDSAQWRAWAVENPGCNFGIVAGPSRWIIADIDVAGGRDEAWALWCGLCSEWGIPVAQPQAQTQSSGWHCYFVLPDNVDPSTLRQPDAIKGVINIRAGQGYAVAAGSVYEGRPYVLRLDVPPYPAPAALVEHCTRTSVKSAAPLIGEYDIDDAAAMLRFLVEQDAFADYESWLHAGMAIRLAFGDAGADLWAICHDDTVTDDVATSKWHSFAADAKPGMTSIATLMKRAHQLGWTGTVRKSTKSMFEGVAAIAAAVGATLLGGRGARQAEAWSCHLDRVPVVARTSAHPEVPDIGHPLIEQINRAIPGIIATRDVEALAVLEAVHSPTSAVVLLRSRTSTSDRSKRAHPDC